ncbi:MAG: hypothetical protein HXY38_03315 [Chloroflexi bacterium]|nr:hypothetical protein [Chloroflexota bacterium]
MRKILIFNILLLAALACSLPGITAPALSPLPTLDSNAVGTVIVQTADAAQTQTAIKLPTSTITPRPTHTPSITSTFTPTFIYLLPTATPNALLTIPVEIFTQQAIQLTETIDGGDNEDQEGAKDKKDPKRMTGKEWSCSTLGASPPRDTVFKPGAYFTVTWTIFNSGTKSWPLNGVDFIYTGGYRHENTKIQDFTQNVPSGGEVRVSASFIAPKKPDAYQTFFTLQVGKTKFCGIKYVFYVKED